MLMDFTFDQVSTLQNWLNYTEIECCKNAKSVKVNFCAIFELVKPTKFTNIKLHVNVKNVEVLFTIQL